MSTGPGDRLVLRSRVAGRAHSTERERGTWKAEGGEVALSFCHKEAGNTEKWQIMEEHVEVVRPSSLGMTGLLSPCTASPSTARAIFSMAHSLV